MSVTFFLILYCLIKIINYFQVIIYNFIFMISVKTTIFDKVLIKKIMFDKDNFINL